MSTNRAPDYVLSHVLLTHMCPYIYPPPLPPSFSRNSHHAEYEEHRHYSSPTSTRVPTLKAATLDESPSQSTYPADVPQAAALADTWAQIDTHGRQARVTDGNTLKELVADICKSVSLRGGIMVSASPDLAERKNKRYFGFNENWTAWRLLPTNGIQDFLDSRDGFRDVVENGHVKIDHCDNSNFLYAEGSFDLTSLRQGFMQGETIEQALRTLLTSSSSITQLSGKKTMGCGCLAHVYKITTVTPRQIAYVATLHSGATFCRPPHLGRRATATSTALRIRRRIVKVFEREDDISKEWARHTLAWWNSRVFGGVSLAAPRSEDATPRRGGQTGSQEDIMQEQLQALVAARAASQTPSTRATTPEELQKGEASTSGYSD
ncbi:hypothetical protein L226DRAFT_569445 [Lentinus tigrinus ALCF2SS1-7]|uniref:uncharacterized protein n=1 Tax=Lentinus tigrinus ALCF2SS1-7 TaxID=1328758 RepID=UPI00116636D1|nr:hypothetical protein L226DRAFT_569445 [Lentinus tigrinus ALCF2SS1-7]